MIELSINKLSILDIVEDTVVDGPGFRISIYCAGCPHHCRGCHNADSWNITNGKWIMVDDLFERIQSLEFNDVTFTGGDPMFQPIGFTALAKRIKEETDKTIWCYTGYRFEELLTSVEQSQLLDYIDVLVDGPYIDKYKDSDLLFRGSHNQRLIDVQASLKHNMIVNWYDKITVFTENDSRTI